ncbi:MAG TPA: GDSL-type esterase/lipase family protein, partial [Gemmatimonadaceae bacterium]|nr:GDSL-type esterase/lipase family protein [Gemmatimonadaceae bacterium]
MRPFATLTPLGALVAALTACASAGTSSGPSTSALSASSCPAAASWTPAPPNSADSLSSYQRSVDARNRNDWAFLGRYREANAALGAPAVGEARVVFMGNSITDGWAKSFPAMFPGKPYVGRGISGQTTPQMLVRFRQDVVALQPKVVVILAGINDIAGNSGPSTQAMIADNLMSMTEIAKANGIRVVLSSVLPAYDFPWRRGIGPAPKVVALNSWIKCYAAQAGAVYL